MISPRDRAHLPVGPPQVRVLELGRTEAAFVRLATDYNSVCDVFVGVQIDHPERVQARIGDALRVLQARHPLLRCVLHRERGQLCFREDPDWRVPVSIAHRGGPTCKEQTWLETWEREYETSPFNVGDGLIKAALFTDATACDLCLFIRHAICDGNSMAWLLHELLGLLGGGDAVVAESPEFGAFEGPVEVLVEQALHRKYPHALSLYSRARGLADFYLPVFMGGAKICLPYADSFRAFVPFRSASALTNSFITSRLAMEFSREDTSRLVEACRAQRATVTSACAAAFVSAFAKFARKPGCDATVSVVTGMRALYEPPIPDATLGCHVGTVMVRIKRNPQEAAFGDMAPDQLWGVARQFAKELSERPNDSKLVLAQHNVDSLDFVPSGNVPPIPLPTFVLSSWGRNVVADAYGPLRVERGLFAQSCRHTVVPVLSMNTMACGRLQVLMLCPRQAFDGDLLRRVFLRAEQVVRGSFLGDRHVQARL